MAPRRKTNKRRNPRPRPSNDLDVYRGPTSPPRSLLLRRQRHTDWLRYEATITSSAGGVISPIYTTADPVAIAQDWSGWSTNYSEYRVDAIDMQFYPIVDSGANNVLIFGLPASTALQTGSLSAATAYTDLLGAGSVRKWSLNRHFKFVARRCGIDEAGFTPIGSAPTTADTFGIKTFASTGYAASTNYGTMVIQYTITFQNRN